MPKQTNLVVKGGFGRGFEADAGQYISVIDLAGSGPAVRPVLCIAHDQLEVGQRVVVGRRKILRARRDGDDHVHERA